MGRVTVGLEEQVGRMAPAERPLDAGVAQDQLHALVEEELRGGELGQRAPQVARQRDCVRRPGPVPSRATARRGLRATRCRCARVITASVPSLPASSDGRW